MYWVKGGDLYLLIHRLALIMCLAHGGEVKVLTFVDGYSTTAIIKKRTICNAR